MKQKLLHFLAVFVAMAIVVQSANAAPEDYVINVNTTPLCNYAADWRGTYVSKQITASNGVIYGIMPGTSRLSFYNTSTQSDGSHLMTYTTGWGSSVDDNGNVVIANGGPTNKVTKVAVFKKSSSWGTVVAATESRTIDLSSAYTEVLSGAGIGRTDFWEASGNLLNGTGYLWFTDGGKVVRLTVPSSGSISQTVFQVPSNAANTEKSTESRFFPIDNGKYVLQNRAGIFQCSISGNTLTVDKEIVDDRNQGCDIITLRGHTIIARNNILSATGTASQNGLIDIYDLTQNKSLATGLKGAVNATGGMTFNGGVVNVICVLEKKNDNTVYLYTHLPTTGMRAFEITATPITSAVTSPKAALASGSTSVVNVTWGKPSQGTATKYAISYSSDGGSTWSTAVETTNLSYTFNNLETGTYKFKVTPYFGGSSTWGPESIAPESIEVITAVGAPISNLAYTYLNNTETNVGRQDITLTWNAPTGMVNTTVTGYKVYRGGSLLATLGADALTYTNTGVKQNYTYKVVPTFDGLTEDASFGLEVTTTEVQAGVLVAPVISETRNYEGYSLVEIFFKMPNYAPYKPLYFNLYRDGKLIQGKLQSYNTLDESLVRASVETTVKYQVEAVYGSAADVYPPIDSVKSDVTTLVIAPRDWAKTGYILQEIYNVPITDIAADKKPNLFDNNNYYRQGQFRDGKWYIAQRSDNLSKQDEDPNSGGGQIDSNVEGATGGILVFNAENADQVKSGYEKIFTKSAFENVGIAMDDAGTLFVRNNNFDKLKATVPTGHGDESAWGWMKDAFERRITEGTFYKRNADGTYSEVATKLDLSKIWTDNRWIDRMYFTGVASNGQVIGRSDYYHMWGDVLSAEGGYLILSPSWTRTAFKVKIVNGQYVSHEVNEFNRYENTGYLLEPKTGTENYGFHLDGRDAVTVQIRSNGYYGVHEWSEAGTTGWHPIYTADSRINNAGGTSIQAFGEVDGTGRHTGELFVITPQSMHSHNVGDFLISRATKENADDYADEGSLMPSTPVAQYVQTDERSNSTATNANGNWFHAEKGTYASAMKDDDECVDIYQYVPGTRFARYRLIPSNQFPPVQPTLDITTAYNDDKTDITHFDGVATWQRPAGFGRSTGSANAKVVSYLFEMYNSKNELVTSAELPELYKTDGTPVDDEYVYDFNYTDTTGNNDIDFGRYSVNVRVKYQTKDGLYHISDPLYAEDIHDYPAEAVQNLATFAFKQANQTVDEWVKKDGKWVVEQKQVDNYRVEINFDKPDCDEPVSYYTVKALVNNKKDMIDITDFHLHKGMEVVNGIEQAILDRDADGKVIPTSVIPGTYDFENSKAPYYHKEGDAFGIAGQSRQNSVLTWHFRVPAGSLSSGVATASNGEEIVITDEPDQWTFIVVAHYAAKNTYIDKDREANAIPGSLIETGVEVVGEDNASSLEIYPIPASTEITIKSAETINSIVIYNEAGAEVMNLDGDNEMVTTVNIESLATGYYFVKVNNQAPVKIIKK
ncbi:MAG: fibronectin type III domain-containing protein [Muribaculaceae bacterium]|nr:fibronectin type III domain-containing protein [Muribaculaceae bacterium]